MPKQKKVQDKKEHEVTYTNNCYALILAILGVPCEDGEHTLLPISDANSDRCDVARDCLEYITDGGFAKFKSKLTKVDNNEISRQAVSAWATE